MTLLVFGIVVVIVLAALYVLNWVFPSPSRPIQVIINVVAALVIFFCVLALFDLMPLPFRLK